MDKINYNYLFKVIGLLMVAGLCLFTLYVKKAMDLQDRAIEVVQIANTELRNICTSTLEQINESNASILGKIEKNYIDLYDFKGKYESHMAITNKMIEIFNKEIESLKKDNK